MLFNTDDLNTDYNTRNTLNLLESMYRIDRVWSKHTPASVPLMESKEYGAFIARYSDLMKLSEEYDASIQECLDAVIYENHLRPNEVVVSLEEWRPYVDPLILHRFSNNYVLVPEINTPAYRLCEICMESFLETGDYTWLDFYVECPRSILNEIAPRWIEGDGVGYDFKTNSATNDTGHWDFTNVSDDELKAWMKQHGKTIRDVRQMGKNHTVDGEVRLNDKQQLKAAEGGKSKMAYDAAVAEMKKRAQAAKQQTDKSTENSSTQEKKDDGPSWFAQKWTALKNWWNNAGQADSNGNVGFFSNLAGKFKNLIGWGNNNQTNNTTNTNQVNNQAAQAAQKAENEKKQAEKTEQQQAEKAAEQAKNDKKQEENTTAPATQPTTTTTQPQTTTAQPAEKKA